MVGPHSNPSLPVVDEDDTRVTLSRFFDIMLPSGILFGGVALLVSIFRSIQHDWRNALILHVSMFITAMVVLFFRHRLSPYLMLSLLILLMSLSVIHSLSTMSLAGEGLMTFFAIITLSALFMGVKTGIFVSIAGVFIIAMIGAGVCMGKIPLNPGIESHLSEPITWILQIASVFMYVIPIILIVDFMRGKMLRSIASLREKNERLIEEIGIRKNAESDYRKSEAKFRHILDNTDEGFFLTEQNGTFVGMNASFARMAGFSSAEAAIQKIPTFFDLPFSDRDLSEIHRLLQVDGLITAYETEWITPAKTLWISLNAKKMIIDGSDHIEGVITDITLRKKAEQALFESEQNYRSIVENSLIGFYIEQDDRIRFANRRFCAITGYDHAEIIDTLGIRDMICPEADSMGNAYLSGSGYQECELKMVRKDSETAIVKLYGNSFYHHQKNAVFGTLIDVTHEKIMENRLRKSEKMETMGTLTSSIVHDFNNILTMLSGYGSMLKTEMGSSSPLTGYVDNILCAAQKATGLTRNLLQFSRLKPVAMMPLNLNEIVRNAEDLLRRLVNADSRFATELCPEELIILADSTQIDQILLNLAVNAGEAMPNGGTLKIRTGREVINDRFIRDHGFGKKGEYALLEVSDTGMGMDEPVLQKMFQPFFTTKELGTGLGLSTVYGNIKQHSGYIHVSSEKQKGTTFFVYLPLWSSLSSA